MNIICKKNWKKTGCCNGALEKYVHEIQVIEGTKVFHSFVFPFTVELTDGSVRFKKNGVESVVSFSDLNQTPEQIKEIISNCNCCPSVQSVTGEYVDNTDPLNPIVNVPMSQLITEGTWAGIALTILNAVNVSGYGFNTGYYTRILNSMHLWGSFTLTTIAGVATFDVPVPFSPNFGAITECGGSFIDSNGSMSGRISGIVGTNNVRFAITTSGGNLSFSYHFSFRI